VPNEIWQAKIANSGAMILGSVGWEFRDEFPWNSSMPMVGEGLLAGGVAGVLVMAAGFAIFLRFLDRAPEPATPVVTGLHVRAAVLAFSPVLLFFLSRGQFVATMAYSTGTLLAVAAAAALISRRISAEADLSPPADAERRPAVARSRPIGARWAAGSTLGARASRRT
jgi:hypothetical protein